MNPLYSFSAFHPLYLIALPVGVFFVFTLLFIASMNMNNTPKPEAIAKAISCYLMKTLGLILMAMGLLPIVYNLLLSSLLPMSSMSVLILLFVVGLGLMIHYNMHLATIDEASVAVPRAIFHYGCEVIGAVTAVTSATSMLAGFLVMESLRGWEISATVLILSLLLMISFSLHRGPRRKETFGMGVKRKK